MIDFGQGVTLAALDTEHLPKLRRWRNDPRVWKWCRQMTPISDQDQRDWFDRQSKNATIQMYTVTVENDVVGVCGFTSIDLVNRRAEFSVYINPDKFGLGLGTRTLKTLFRHGFEQWGFNVIWGETFQGNEAAGLFKKLGMTNEGTRRDFYFRNGKFIGADLYSIRASEWKN